MLRKLLLPVLLSSLMFSANAQDVTYREWVNKAMAYYEAKQYKESADAFTKAFAAFGGKGYPDDRYNAACSWAQAGNKDSAFFQLQRIAEKTKFADIDHLMTDSDLPSLRTDKRWAPLCALVRKI